MGHDGLDVHHADANGHDEFVDPALHHHIGTDHDALIDSHHDSLAGAHQSPTPAPGAMPVPTVPLQSAMPVPTTPAVDAMGNPVQRSPPTPTVDPFGDDASFPQDTVPLGEPIDPMHALNHPRATHHKSFPQHAAQKAHKYVDEPGCVRRFVL